MVNDKTGMAIIYWLLLLPTACLILGLSCLLCWFHWTRRKMISVARVLPIMYPTWPILGNAFGLVYGLEVISEEMIKTLKKAVMQNVTTWITWFGPFPVFMNSEPQDIQVVLNNSKSLDRSSEMDYVKHALGNGLLTAKGQTWKISRRNINPMFHHRNLDLLIPALNICGRNLIATLSKYVGCGPVNIEKDVYITTIKSSGCLVFGAETGLKIPEDDYKKFITSVTCSTSMMLKRLWRFWLWPEQIFKFLYRKELEEASKLWEQFIKQPLQTIENQREQSDSSVNADEGDNVPRGEGQKEQITLIDCYDVIMKNHPDFTYKDLKNELMTLMFASSETSKELFGCCLLSLGANPTIQERLYEEVVSVVGNQDCDSDVTLEQLRAMPYLDQVFNEVLRKFTIIPITLRQMQEDMKLTYVTVPAGSTFAISIAGVHYDPKYYPDPERFDPDRFSPENVAQRPKGTFIPFSLGPRNCIGKYYAALSLKILLVRLIRRFRVSTKMDIHNFKLMFSIVLCSANGYHVAFENRL